MLRFIGQCQGMLCLEIWHVYAGTIAKLGTEKHHTQFLPRLDTLDLPGCFGCAGVCAPCALNACRA